MKKVLIEIGKAILNTIMTIMISIGILSMGVMTAILYGLVAIVVIPWNVTKCLFIKKYGFAEATDETIYVFLETLDKLDGFMNSDN